VTSFHACCLLDASLPRAPWTGASVTAASGGHGGGSSPRWF
jgi:hypothetical protein